MADDLGDPARALVNEVEQMPPRMLSNVSAGLQFADALDPAERAIVIEAVLKEIELTGGPLTLPPMAGASPRDFRNFLAAVSTIVGLATQFHVSSEQFVSAVKVHFVPSGSQSHALVAISNAAAERRVVFEQAIDRTRLAYSVLPS